MAVIRQFNVLGQMRLDAAHFRTFESGVAGDFDLLAGKMLAGKVPLVVSGFKLNANGVTAAEDLRLQTAGGHLIHYAASESGSIFDVPADREEELLVPTNPRVSGQFVPNQVNYVGIDLVRRSDETTSDLVMFLNATSLLETSEEVPLARTLDYRIVISTVDFSSLPGVCPVAKVRTDSTNTIVSITDARNRFFRLGSGGTAPNRQSSYSWPEGRKEFTETNEDLFAGGDKSISSLKQALDALMTRIWEIGGGEYWYSATAERNVRMVHTGLPFVSTGEHFEYTGGHLHWQGLRVLFDNSTASYNEVANVTTNVTGTTDLADGDCLYVDLDRTTNRTGGTALVAKRAPLVTLGTGSPPGSRIALAWRAGSEIFTRDQGYAVASSFKLATIAAAGTVKLSATDPTVGGGATSVATVHGTNRRAYAGGMTRGATGSDFPGGAGDLDIGGLDLDHNVNVATVRSQDATRVTGIQAFASGGRATQEVVNQAPILASANQVQRWGAYNDVLATDQDVVIQYANGAIGHRVVDTVNFPVTPPSPTVGSPIRCIRFFRTNGLASPNTRDQEVIMWFDGTETLIAESPEY